MKFKVPRNISLETELFRGFDKKSAYITAIVMAITFIISILLYFLIGKKILLWLTIFEIVTLAFLVGVLTKLENNMSIATYLKLMIGFSKEQQTFEIESEEEKCLK